MLWQSYDRLNPLDAATRFARDVFPGRREVESQSLIGEWYGYEYLGRFQLVDGTRYYSLTFDGTRWGVQAA